MNRELLIARLEMWQHALELVWREIHDNTGQALSLVKLNLGELPVPAEKAQTVLLMQSRKLVARGIQDLRRVANPVNEELVRQKGIHAALKQETMLINQVNKSQVLFMPGNRFYRFHHDTELLFFRILQELLDIVSVSAAGRALELVTHFGHRLVKAVIRDTPGKNAFFEYPVIGSLGPGPVTSKLYARARFIRAVLTIKNKPAKGLEIVLQLPVPASDKFNL